MDILQTIQSNYAAINSAAGEYLAKLTLQDLNKDITISAEMAGLMMLRDSGVNLDSIVSGTALLGAITDEVAKTMNRFVFSWAISNGLNPREINIAGLTTEAKAYLPELTRYEKPLYDVCEKHRIARELFSFVAATSAMKLVAAGKVLGVLDQKLGQAMVLFHIIAGSKTVPYPPPRATL
jgi:hypothetical protein